ncbi:MAG: helicase SNF2 [Proteobacteria bacterium]|nr:DEAD/DEAH box helicase [Alphaproteobacteria bacterium]NCC03139.1 helicase SNF2 [Pseudomonadota bacterium]
MIINTLDIVKNFEARDSEAGRIYHINGHVKSVDIDEKSLRVKALVQGSARTPYTVDIEILKKHGLTKIESYCSCPMGYMCKHGAAALYEAIAQQMRKHERIKSPIVKAKNKGQKKETLSWPLTQWLQSLGSTDGDKTEALSDRIIYLLVIDPQSSAGAKIVPAIQHRLRDGSWSRYRTLTAAQLDSLNNQDKILTSRDHDALMILSFDALSAKDNQAYWELPVDPELIDLFLARIIRTGRAFLHNDEALAVQPLTLGSPVHAQLNWITSGGTRQKPAIIPSLSGLQILTSGSPWYLNPLTLEAGPLLCEEDRRTVSAFLKAPIVQENEIEPLRQKMATQHSPVPHPYIIKKGATKKTAPRARIEILPKGQHGESYARLSFLYEGTAIAPDNTEPHYGVASGDELSLYPRNPKAEQHYLKTIEENGLRLFPLQDSERDTATEQLLVPASLNPSPWFWLDFHYLGKGTLKETGVEIVDHTRQDQQIIDPDTQDIEASFTQKGEWWFAMDLGITVEGQRIELLPILVSMLKEIKSGEDIENLTQSGKCFAPLPDGRRIALPADRIRSILKTLVELYDEKPLDDEGKLKVSMDLTAAFLKLEAITRKRWVGESQLRKLVEKLASFEGIKKTALPKVLKATLRSYQVDGYNWLNFLGSYGLSGILADDMGLGKTVQALAYIQAQKEKGLMEGPCLIIMPTSLIANWQAEIARFTPDLKILTLHGKDRLKLHKKIKQSDIVLTTYPLLPRDSEDLMKVTWDLIILDEAQAIKNPSAKMTQAACSLSAKQRLCLTGTPVENHLGEAWSLFTFLMPGLLGDHRSFSKYYRNPIEKEMDTERKDLFARRLRPFILRRLKTEVAKELPPKTEIIRRVTLSERQQDLYESVRHVMNDRVREEITAKGLARSHIVILDALLKLRQTCCDPRLVKLDEARKVEESAKLEELMEMLPTLIEDGRRILLFSQFTSMLDLIKPELKKLDIPYVELRGSTKDRATPIKRFQAGEVPLFLISLKAGGTGLNLTAADTVIHYDPWWNPSVENQATDRAHRIGQDKPVFVYKLIVKDTVEERILELQHKKAGLASALFGDNPSAAANLSQDDIRWLMGE